MKSSLAALAVLLASAAVAVSAANKNPTVSGANARFYFDLGPSQIDVSGYPKIQQENYMIFERSCSKCHTLARPINSPIATAKGWRRYVWRMYVRTKNAPIKPFTRAEMDSILSFLVYDSNLRKIRNKKQFLAQSAALKKEFAQAEKKRIHAEKQKNENGARHSYPYTGVSPRPF